MARSVVLNLETLKLIDSGAVSHAFDNALRELADDISFRAKLNKKRSVALLVECEPMTNDAGACIGSTVRIAVKKSIPQMRSNPYVMEVQPRVNDLAVLVFKPDSPEDVRQATFDDVAEGDAP